MELGFIAIGFAIGMFVGTIIEHFVARKPNHYGG